MKQRLLFIATAITILGAIFLTYSNHFYNDFHFDDSHTVIDNAYIRDIKNIPLFFRDCTTSSAMPSHQGYRPLVTTTLAVDYAMSMKSSRGKNGYDTFWYHVSNFTWFVLIVILLYFIQIKLYNFAFAGPYNRYFALLGCAWYGLHTVNAETINYIISRSDILSTLAIVASFAIYISFENLRKYYLYLIPAIVGMFAKETTVMFAPALIMYDYMIERQKNLTEVFNLKTIMGFFTLKNFFILIGMITPVLMMYNFQKSDEPFFTLLKIFVPVFLLIIYYYIRVRQKSQENLFMLIGMFAPVLILYDYIFVSQKNQVDLIILFAIFAMVLMLFAYLFLRHKSLKNLFTPTGQNNLFSSLVVGAPALIIGLILGYFSLKMTTHVEPGGGSTLWYIASQPYIALHYVVQFFFPFGLTADTDIGAVGALSDDRLYIGFAFFAGLIILAFKTSGKKEWRPFSFGIIWFLLMLLPTSLVALAEVTNDHRPFLPNIGLVFSMVCLVANLYYYILKNNFILKTGVLALVLCALGGYAYGAHERNKVWKTDEALWRDVSEKSPHNGRGWMNYGLTLMARGDYADAQYAYDQALIYASRYYILHINIGVLKEAQGQKAEAEQYYKNALDYGPDYVEPYYYYARYLFNMGRAKEAEIYCNKGLELFAGHIYSRYLLMDIYYGEKDWQKLLASAQTTLSMYPGDAKAETYIKIAGNPSSAIETLSQNKTLSAPDLLNQSLAYYHAGRYQECIAACFKALELQPNFPEAYNNIGTAYNQLQKYDSAVWACSKALELKPDFPLAKNNLAWAKKQLKK